MSLTEFEKDIESFLQQKKLSRGGSPHTQDAYRRDLHHFKTYLSEHALDPYKLDEGHFENYLEALILEGKSDNSLRRKKSAIGQFYLYCLNHKKILKNPVQDSLGIKRPVTLPKSLGHHEITQLLDAANTGYPYPAEKREALNYRDKVILLILYGCGLRVSELTQLTLENVECDTGWLRVLGKGQKERKVPIPQLLGDALIIYATHFRLTLGGSQNPKSPYILDQSGKPLTRQRIWQILKQLAQVAGLERFPHPHQLRHTFATHLLEGGLHLRALQQLLGHQDLSTTQIYTSVQPSHLSVTVRKFHPKGG